MNEAVETIETKEKIKSRLKTIDSTSLLSTKTKIYLPFKRIMDIIFGIVGLVLTIPFFILIKISYLLSKDNEPIIFKHKRIGKNGKEFYLYKFRTMIPNAEEVLKEMLKDKKYRNEWKEFHKFDNDPRITKMGAIYRKLSLDELPQFLNIIKGEMSLIGPRPLIEEEVLEYRNKKNLLLSVRPGLTGWWACNGRSCTTNKQRKDLELYYVRHCGLLIDIKCFILTIFKVLKQDGAK